MTTTTTTTTVEETRSKTSITTVTTVCTCRTIVDSECCCGSSCACAAPVRETIQPRVAPFVMQLYRLTSDTANKDIIEWLPGSNEMFVVNRIDDFSRVLLPRYYNHSNWSSFLRQLNNYGFKRVASDNVQDKWVFSHPNFIKHREDLLSKVVRISNTKQQATATATIVTNNNDQKNAKRRSKTNVTFSTKSSKISSDIVKLSSESNSTTDLNSDNSTKEADNSHNNSTTTTTSSLQSLHEKIDRCLQNQEQILQEQQRIVRLMTTHEEECALARDRHNSLTNTDLSDWLSIQK